MATSWRCVIEAIHAKLPNTHLVMHGSSSVPQELQDLINAQLAARCPRPIGVPVEEIERGIRHGVRKVNIDTDCRMAMTGSSARSPGEASEFDPRKFLIPAMEAMEDLCRDRFEAFRHGRQRLEDQVIRWTRWPSATPRRARPANRRRQGRLTLF
jgi:fructose-bisphosphate aldolase class II